MEPELERLFERVSGYFALLSEPTRLKILNAICDGERSVSDIVEKSVNRLHKEEIDSIAEIETSEDAPVINIVNSLISQAIKNVADENMINLCRAACVHVASGSEEQAIHGRTLRRFMPRSTS